MNNTDVRFQKWWETQLSIDYDEMLVAAAAWDYQEERIRELEKAAQAVVGNDPISVGDGATGYVRMEVAVIDALVAVLSPDRGEKV